MKMIQKFPGRKWVGVGGGGTPPPACYVTAHTTLESAKLVFFVSQARINKRMLCEMCAFTAKPSAHLLCKLDCVRVSINCLGLWIKSFFKTRRSQTGGPSESLMLAPWSKVEE